MLNSVETQIASKSQQLVLKTPIQFLQEIKRDSIENIEVDIDIPSSPVIYHENTFLNTYYNASNDNLSNNSDSNDDSNKENEITEDRSSNIISTRFGDINGDEIAQNPSVCIERTGNVVRRRINLTYFKNKQFFRSNCMNNEVIKPIQKPKRVGRKRIKVICSTCNKNVVKDVKSDGRPYRTCEKCKERKKNSYFKKHLKDIDKFLNLKLCDDDSNN